MAVEKKDLLDFLGLKEEPETIDAFKEVFQKDFIARSAAANDPEIQEKAASKMGGRIGSIETLFKQGAKELGVEKIEGEKAEDIIKNGLNAFRSQFETLKTADKKTKSQREAELETDLNKYKTQYETEKQGREAANKLLEDKDKEVSTFKKNWTIEQQLGEAYKAVPFTDDYKNDPIRQKGFKQFLAEETQFDLNEKGELVILKKDGTPFTNDAKNIHKTPVEVLAEFADKAKIKANNNLNNQRPSVKQQMDQQNAQREQGGNVPGHGYKKKS